MSTVWRKVSNNPFWSFGLPFTIMVLGSTYVLTTIRSERDNLRSQTANSRRPASGLYLNSLEQDLEEFAEKSKTIDEYDMMPVTQGRRQP